jgi:hypothetical protein
MTSIVLSFQNRKRLNQIVRTGSKAAFSPGSLSCRGQLGTVAGSNSVLGVSPDRADRGREEAGGKTARSESY